MKKVITILGTITLMAISSLNSFAQFTCPDGSIAAQSRNRTFTVPYAAPAPVIDGDLTDGVWISTVGGAYNSTTKTFPAAIAEEINLRISSQGDCGNTNDVSASEFAGFEGTFSLLWDEDFLYIAAYVKDVNANNSGIPTGSDRAALEMFYCSDTVTSAHPNFDTNWPRAYNTTRDMQLQLNLKQTGNYPMVLGDITNHGNQIGSTDTFAVVTQTTDDGYIVEGKLPWKALQRAFVDANNLYETNPANAAYYRRPASGRKFRFDLAIQSMIGTKRAQKMWNMCCSNRNWTESQFFGTILLGQKVTVPCATSVSISPSTPTISTPNGSLNLTASVLPSNASQAVSWSAIELADADYATIDQTGKITALKNGTITVTASTLVNANCPTSQTVSVPVVITGQISPASVTVNASDIVRSWGSITASASVKDAAGSSTNVPQNVIWSITSGENLAFINSLTGVVTSKGIGNGEVTIKATSTVAPTISASKTISISGQAMLQSFTISGYGGAVDNPCRSALNTTFVGFSGTSTKVTIAAYYDSAGCATKVIPGEFINFTVTGPSGVTVPATIEYVSSTKSWQATLLNTTGTLSITGTLVHDPTKRVVTRVLLRGAVVATTLGCSGIFVCNTSGGTTTGVDLDAVSNDLILYPNPTSASFKVQLNASASGSATIQVVNSVGTLVYSTSTNIAVGKNETDIKAALAPGFYMVNVAAGSKKYSKKLFVE